MPLPRRSRLVTLSSALSLSLGCAGLLGEAPEPSPKRRIVLREDGSCEQQVDISCPPPDVATCNPPMPMPVDCPPLQIRSITRLEDGTCRKSISFADCPADAACDAGATVLSDCPASLAGGATGTLSKQHAYGCSWTATGGQTTPVACPPEMEAPPQEGYHFDPVEGGGLCMAYPIDDDDHCPPDANCNPPPPQWVVCPPSRK